MTIVRKTRSEIPPMTPERAAELRALANRPASEIDTSDIPEIADMSQAGFFKPVKRPVTVRIDADVLHWLKSGGDGYQRRLNAILRAAMQKDAQQDRSAEVREAASV